MCIRKTEWNFQQEELTPNWMRETLAYYKEMAGKQEVVFGVQKARG